MPTTSDRKRSVKTLWCKNRVSGVIPPHLAQGSRSLVSRALVPPSRRYLLQDAGSTWIGRTPWRGSTGTVAGGILVLPVLVVWRYHGNRL